MTLRLNRLQLFQYRCFPEFAIDFHEQLTVLVAPNGLGKTAILDAIAVAIGPYVGAFDEATGKHFSSGDIRRAKVRSTASNEMESAADGVRLDADGHIGTEHHPTQWSRSLSGATHAKTTIRDARPLIQYGKQMQRAVRQGQEDILPLLSYYGTGRLWQLKKLMPGRLTRTSRTVAYTDCLEQGSSYKTFVEWFRYWSHNASILRLEASESGRPYTQTEFDHLIASVTLAVNTCLAPVGWGRLKYSFALEDLTAQHDHYGQLPVSLLSDGIRNMIGMVADIAFRATKLNSHLGSGAAQQTPGIILIDEVDMHLHPEWQQVVLADLTRAFPRMQFIVTTHSPQVLTTVRAEQIRIIGRTGEQWYGKRPAVSPLARPSGDALAYIMGVNPRPPLDILEILHDYEQMVRCGQMGNPQAHAIRARLDAAGVDIPEADMALWQFLGQHAREYGHG